MIEVVPLEGIPEVRPGDDIAELLIAAAGNDGLRDGDVVVVTQKIVSKAEGRLVPEEDRDQAILSESRRILRRVERMTISETRHGFVCANAGVDASNVETGRVALLPVDPDASARRIRARIARRMGTDVAVIVTDTFGRAWRLGQTDVAIGIAGMDPFLDLRGSTDAQGRPLLATRICVADEIAGAAELVMGKARGICAAVVRGVSFQPTDGSATQIVRPPRDDLFR